MKLRQMFYTQIERRTFHTAWVKNGSVRARVARPFYPQEQTSSACPGMSVWCHNRTFARSLNYLIGTHEEPRRYGKPQLLGCLEVDGQLEFGYLVDRDVAGFCSSENCVDIVGDALIQFDQVEGVGH